MSSREIFQMVKNRGHPELNQGPLDLQSNALPLSYIPVGVTHKEAQYKSFLSTCHENFFQAKDAETTSSEKEIQNRLPVNPWTGAIIYGATAPPRPQPRPRGPAVNRGAAKPKTSDNKPTRTDSNPNQKKNQVNTVVAEKQVIGRVFTIFVTAIFVYII